MKAVILAAGKPAVGVGPITNMSINGHNLLDLQISCLRSCGIEDISLISGYDHEKIERSDISIRHNKSWDKSGSLESLKCASDIFDGEDDVLVVYGDTIFEPDVVKLLLRSSGEISAVCYLDRKDRDKGIFREYAQIEDGTISAVTESENKHGVRTVYTGMLYVRASKTKIINKYLSGNEKSTKSHVGGILNEMTQYGVELTPVIIENGWAEITSNELYTDALTDNVFIDNVTQIHTDWSQRSIRYNSLDWVNNDALLSGITDVVYNFKPKCTIDIGTGTGKVLHALKDTFPEGEYWGVDYSQSMLDKMNRKDEFNLECCDIESFVSLPKDYFDFVTARMVFHHINDSDSAMKNICHILKDNGIFLVCEGVPPTQRTVKWYTEMFRYKEDRRTLTEIDLINMLYRAGFSNITTKTIIMNNCSLNNWLDNSGIPQENIDHIKKLHYEAPDFVRDDYNMKYTDDDCLMTWKFAITYGCFSENG